MGVGRRDAIDAQGEPRAVVPVALGRPRRGGTERRVAQAGFELAIKLSRMGVKATQSSDQIRKQLRMAYDHDIAQLIATSQVVTLIFQTVAAANSWWR